MAQTESLMAQQQAWWPNDKPDGWSESHIECHIESHIACHIESDIESNIH